MDKFKFKTICIFITAVFLFNITEKAPLYESEREDLFIKSAISLHKRKEPVTRILTYNLLSDGLIYGGADVNLRKDGVIKLLKGLSPDILALQEMNLSWFNALNKSINLSYINTQKSFLKTNMTAVFYNEKTLQLLDFGETEYKSAGNPRLRKILWAHFQDIKSGKTFSVINTHLSLSDKENKAALSQAFQLIEFSKSLQTRYNSPVIITGDFNAYPKDVRISESSAVYETLCLNFTHTLENSENISQGKEKSFISTTDHIFFRGEIEIKSLNILSNKELNRLSDHFPLYSDISFY